MEKEGKNSSNKVYYCRQIRLFLKKPKTMTQIGPTTINFRPGPNCRSYPTQPQIECLYQPGPYALLVVANICQIGSVRIDRLSNLRLVNFLIWTNWIWSLNHELTIFLVQLFIWLLNSRLWLEFCEKCKIPYRI